MNTREAQMAIKLRPDEIIKECRWCYWFRPQSYRQRCAYTDKLEFGKYGKCLKKRKPKW